MDTYHWDVVGCFIWDLFETSWRRTDETSSLRSLETSSRHTNKMWRRTTDTSSRRSTETSLGVSFETYLRRRWDVERDVVPTSPRRLVAGWEVVFLKILQKFKQLFYRTPLVAPSKRFYWIPKRNSQFDKSFSYEDV